MLPQKYTDVATKRPTSSNVPLGITGVACQSEILQIQGCQVRFSFYRPQSKQPPLVCVAGGPGLTSRYLNGLLHTLNRSVVLYDVLTYPSTENYLELAVSILHGILHRVNRPLHLLGHSYGGIVVYESLKCNNSHILSVLLVSTPTNLKDSNRCRRDILQELELDSDTPELDFQRLHECRITPMPLPLVDSLRNRRTIRVAQDFVAEHVHETVPALILYGQYDFIQDTAWTKYFVHSQTMTIVLAGCSHYSMVENEELFGSSVQTFLEQLEASKEEETAQFEDLKG